jgi:hypothetical protein
MKYTLMFLYGKIQANPVIMRTYKWGMKAPIEHNLQT